MRKLFLSFVSVSLLILSVSCVTTYTSNDESFNLLPQNINASNISLSKGKYSESFVVDGVEYSVSYFDCRGGYASFFVGIQNNGNKTIRFLEQQISGYYKDGGSLISLGTWNASEYYKKYSSSVYNSAYGYYATDFLSTVQQNLLYSSDIKSGGSYIVGLVAFPKHRNAYEIRIKAHDGTVLTYKFLYAGSYK